MSVPSTVILASAGTGKTFQLTGRYVSLLCQGVEPSRILAATFTRLAAGQIFERVVARLLDAAEARQKAEGAPPDESPVLPADALGALLRRIDRVAIGTLDSFFAKLASAYAAELDLPPGWRMVADDEDERLRAEAVERALEAGSPDDLLRLLQLMMSKRYTSAIASSLLDTVADAHAIFQGATPEAWDAVGVPDEGNLPDKDRLREITESWFDLPLPRTKTGRPDQRWEKAHAAALEAFVAKDYERFVGQGLAAQANCDAPQFYKTPIPESICAAYRPLLAHARHALLTRHAESTRATRDLLQRFDEAYWQLKRERRAYRFEDVPLLLSRVESGITLEEIAFRLDGLIDHVLLDEFQDTAVPQFTLLEPLLEEILAGGGGLSEDASARSVLCVGDLKQSLYQWRNAEPALFAALPERWPQLRVEELHHSHRSSPVVLSAVNEVFGSLATNLALADVPEAAARWQKDFHAHEAAGKAKKAPGHVRLSVAPAAPDGGDQTTSTLAAAARTVAGLVAANPSLTIGVLVRGKKAIPRLIFELKRLGVDASEEGGNPLTDAPAVAAALSLLQLMDYPGDSAAAFHVATSPLGARLHFTQWKSAAARAALASRLRAQASELGFAPLLCTWLGAIAQDCDARDVRRFEQLIDLADEFDDRADPRAEHLVAMARSRRVADPAAHPVRVMTVHGSKGLEFDAVVLPDLDARIGAHTPGIIYERSDPFGPIDVVSRYANECVRSLDPRLEALYRVHKNRLTTESLCILYVAMTRAKHCLEMIIEPCVPKDPLKLDTSSPADKLPFSFAGILRGRFAPTPHCVEGVLMEAGDAGWHKHVPQAAAPAPPRPITLPLAPAQSPAPRPTAPSSHAHDESSNRGARTPRAPRSTAQPQDNPTHGLDNAAEAADPAPPSPFVARLDPRLVSRGLLVHAWLQHLDWLDDHVPTAADLLALARRHRLHLTIDPLLNLEREAARLVETLRAPAIRNALSRSRYPAATFAPTLRILREAPFALANQDAPSAPTLGRLDRLVIGLDQHSTPIAAEVLDFKTDALPIAPAKPQLRAAEASRPTPFAAELAARYTPQLESYRLAAARLTGLSPARVRVTLLALAAGAALEIPHPAGVPSSKGR